MRVSLERGDAVSFAFFGDVNIDLGGADVDVAGEYTDDFHGHAAFGEHRAEGVPQA
jgi:hypothetical protein